MSFQVKLEAKAAAEIQMAYEWYESQRSGLGAEFLSSIAAAQEALSRDPLRFREIRAPYRWINLRKFPYALHFRIRGASLVLITACIHHRRSPARWPGA